jgi:hypothetical protein
MPHLQRDTLLEKGYTLPSQMKFVFSPAGAIGRTHAKLSFLKGVGREVEGPGM